MLSQKYDNADLISIEAAECLHNDCGVVIVVTDGRYVQIDNEEKR